MEKNVITAFLIAFSIFFSECRSYDNGSSLNNSAAKKTGCACNLGNKPTVPEIFNKKEILDYERLVVYLYRNKQNNKILLHIPDNIKQTYLPDINYEEIDVLKTVEEEKVVHLFENYPKYIISYPDRIQHENLSTPEVSTTTPYNNRKITTHENKIIEVTAPTSSSTIKQHSKNPIVPESTPIPVPSHTKKGDSKIYYYHPKDFVNKHPTKVILKEIKNNGKPVSIENDDSRHQNYPKFLPVNVITESPTVVVIHPDNVPSNSNEIDKHTPKDAFVGVKIPDNFIVKPPYKNLVPDKVTPHDKVDFPDYTTPVLNDNYDDDLKNHEVKYPDNSVAVPSRKYPSTPKTPTTQHLYPEENKITHDFKYPDNSILIPPVEKIVPNKSKQRDNEKPSIHPSQGSKEISHKPIGIKRPQYKEDKVIHGHPIRIPPWTDYVKKPSQHPSYRPKDVPYISKKVPSSKHDANKPISHPNINKKTPTNVDVATEKHLHRKKNKNNTTKPSYETIVDIVISYPEFVISPDGKGSKSKASKVKTHKPNAETDVIIDIPRIPVITPSTKYVPILRVPVSTPNQRKNNRDDSFIQTSTEKNHQFDRDTNDIYYKNPETVFYIPEYVANKDESNPKDEISLCDYCKQHAKDNNINPKLPGSIEIEVSKSTDNTPTCNYCKQKNIRKSNNNKMSDNILTYIRQKTFDQWFREEMYEFRQNKDDIDVNLVGKYIIKILNEHGMYISEEGLLTDYTGKVMPLQNLKLRAMFVGDSVGLDTIWKSPDSKEKDAEYITFVILMTIEPLKTLGIIPLGRTVLPFPTTSFELLSNDALKPKEMSVNQQRMDPYHYDKPILIDKLGRYMKRASNEYDESVERFLNTMHHHSPVSNDEVYHISEDLLEYDNNVILDKNGLEQNKHNHDYINSEDLYGHDDMLRIIGGSAATGSGTPVSSKGKSIRFDD